jgi:hypothetical protein
MKDAAASILVDLLGLVLAKGIRLADTDPAGYRKLLEEFDAKLRGLSTRDIEAAGQLATALAAWSEEVEATRIGGASGDARLRRAPDGDDWFYRPAVARLCSYTDLVDGTLDLADVLRMNKLLDVKEVNERITAGDAAPPLRLARSATTTGAAEWQAAYDARVTKEHVPSFAEDRDWAAGEGMSQKEVARLRSNNKDPRLHKKGRRYRGI